MIQALQKAVAYAGKKRSNKWPGVRRSHLAKFPTCAACGGNDACEVHHITPFHVGPELELSPQNLLTLCEAGPFGSCHRLLGHNGAWADWNPNCEATATHTLTAIRSIHSAKGRPTPK